MQKSINLYYYKNVTYFSFLSEGEIERESERKRELLRTRKKHTQNVCARKSGIDYCIHGNFRPRFIFKSFALIASGRI